MSAKALLSLNDMGGRTFQMRLPPECHLQLQMEDVLEDHEFGAPKREQVEQGIIWCRKFHNDPIVINCHAGVSRSTAFAFAVLVDRFGIDNINDIVKWMEKIRPQACPNPIISRHADDFLQCDNKLFESTEKVAKKHLFNIFGIGERN